LTDNPHNQGFLIEILDLFYGEFPQISVAKETELCILFKNLSKKNLSKLKQRDLSGQELLPITLDVQ